MRLPSLSRVLSVRHKSSRLKRFWGWSEHPKGNRVFVLTVRSGFDARTRNYPTIDSEQSSTNAEL